MTQNDKCIHDNEYMNAKDISVQVLDQEQQMALESVAHEAPLLKMKSATCRMSMTS